MTKKKIEETNTIRLRHNFPTVDREYIKLIRSGSQLKHGENILLDFNESSINLVSRLMAGTVITLPIVIVAFLGEAVASAFADNEIEKLG